MEDVSTMLGDQRFLLEKLEEPEEPRNTVEPEELRWLEGGKHPILV